MHRSNPPFPSFNVKLLNYIFFFNDTATTEIYTLSLHDALPILAGVVPLQRLPLRHGVACPTEHPRQCATTKRKRSEEHTSELQSRSDLVCRLLLEKKKIRGVAKCIHLNALMKTTHTRLNHQTIN